MMIHDTAFTPKENLAMNVDTFIDENKMEPH